MNAETIKSFFDWDVLFSDDTHIRLSSPFTLADDGELLALNITYPTPDTFFLSDAYQVAMHADSYGIRLDRHKIDALNRTMGVYSARFTESGEITASGKIELLQDAMIDAIKLALALSFNYSRWLPKFHEISFRALVAKSLKKDIPEDSLAFDYAVTGSSGHMLKFPFAVKVNNGSHVLIETIAAEETHIDWGNVYKTHGKFHDVKLSNEEDRRLVIMDSSALPENFSRAATYLADIASVRALSSTSNWAEALKVA